MSLSKGERSFTQEMVDEDQKMFDATSTTSASAGAAAAVSAIGGHGLYPSPKAKELHAAERASAGAGGAAATRASAIDEGKTDFDMEERVVLNVGGKRFETYVTTLLNYPDTLLGAMFSRRNFHLRRPDVRGEHFFDRDPIAFSAILNFYRTGRVFLPPGVSEELLQEELQYFNIDVGSDEGDPKREVCTWGRGEYGQLGHGCRSNATEPK